MNKVIKNSLLSLMLFTAVNSSVSAKINEEIEKSFSVSPSSDFILNNINGAVTINSWQESNIKVQAVITAPSQDSRDNVVVEMNQHGNRVMVNTDYKDKAYRQRNESAAKVDYQVWLPSKTNLSDIELVNGALVIKGVAGEIDAAVVNGSINASGLSNNSDISSVNGSVNVSYQSSLKEVSNIDLETVNGSIKLFLPEGINADVNADTMHGGIKTSFGLTATKNSFSGRNLRGEIGSGGTKIDLESINGSIKVLKSE